MSVASAPAREIEERSAPTSPAGPVEPGTPLRLPPMRAGNRLVQSLQFVASPLATSLRGRERYGDVWQIELLSRKEPFVVTTHPDHVKSLLTAKPEDAPSLTGESPLRPILGPNSVLTSVGERHMRQRKLLLPPFHGEAVQRYVEMIVEVADREIDRWPAGQAVRAGAADAGGDARRDHGRDLRDRSHARRAAPPSTGCARRSGGC